MTHEKEINAIDTFLKDTAYQQAVSLGNLIDCFNSIKMNISDIEDEYAYMCIVQKHQYRKNILKASLGKDIGPEEEEFWQLLERSFKVPKAKD